MGSHKTLKRCCSCKEEKDIFDFHKDKSREDQKYPACKKCTNKRNHLYQVRVKDTPHYKTRGRRNWIKYEYGISLEDYEKLLIQQNFLCFICGKQLGLFKKHTHLDHNHKTKKIRKFLCRGCNQGIGNFEENTKNMGNAINYLKEYN